MNTQNVQERVFSDILRIYRGKWMVPYYFQSDALKCVQELRQSYDNYNMLLKQFKYLGGGERMAFFYEFIVVSL